MCRVFIEIEGKLFCVQKKVGLSFRTTQKMSDNRAGRAEFTFFVFFSDKFPEGDNVFGVLVKIRSLAPLNEFCILEIVNFHTTIFLSVVCCLAVRYIGTLAGDAGPGQR